MGVIPEATVLAFLSQIIDAFKVLTAKNIMHRDLKPGNIFFHNGQIKIGDFGFCKSL
jgi:serine/threonine protein kinase